MTDLVTDTWNRSRLAILDRVVGMSTGKKYANDSVPTSYEGFIHGHQPRLGDLVRIESVLQPTKWYLSWFVEMYDTSWNRCLLQSIDDHECCVWENIGLSVYDRTVIEKHAEFRWSDGQWDFWDRWSAPDPKNDPYIVLPMMPVFDGNSVTIQCRIRFGFGGPTEPVTFPNWREVSDKQLLNTYRDAVKQHERRDKNGR